VTQLDRKAQMNERHQDFAGYEKHERFKSYGPGIIAYF
jgi:hypothetical protein